MPFNDSGAAILGVMGSPTGASAGERDLSDRDDVAGAEAAVAGREDQDQ
jgi:hypothetical protein